MNFFFHQFVDFLAELLPSERGRPLPLPDGLG